MILKYLGTCMFEKLNISNETKKLTNKRNNKIKDYAHKSTKELVERLKQSGVSKVVIGKNIGWKDEINIGKKTNQNFVSIPHALSLDILKYKLEMEGISVILQEESYTSLCSCYDLESIKFHNSYVGKRTKRNFTTKDGLNINADINGGGNILRKAIPNAFNSHGTEGLVVNPVKLTVKR